jgi:hypothetical protein
VDARVNSQRGKEIHCASGANPARFVAGWLNGFHIFGATLDFVPLLNLLLLATCTLSTCVFVGHEFLTFAIGFCITWVRPSALSQLVYGQESDPSQRDGDEPDVDPACEICACNRAAMC